MRARRPLQVHEVVHPDDVAGVLSELGAARAAGVGACSAACATARRARTPAGRRWRASSRRAGAASTASHAMRTRRARRRARSRIYFSARWCVCIRAHLRARSRVTSLSLTHVTPCACPRAVRPALQHAVRHRRLGAAAPPPGRVRRRGGGLPGGRGAHQLRHAERPGQQRAGAAQAGAWRARAARAALLRAHSAARRHPNVRHGQVRYCRYSLQLLRWCCQVDGVRGVRLAAMAAGARAPRP
jgi:hypothetical protein